MEKQRGRRACPRIGAMKEYRKKTKKKRNWRKSGRSKVLRNKIGREG
jgi:hypothetical protein